MEELTVPTSIPRILNIFINLKKDNVENISNSEKNIIFNLFILKLINNLNSEITNYELYEYNLKNYSPLIYLHNQLCKLIKNYNFNYKIQTLYFENKKIPKNVYNLRCQKVKLEQSHLYSYSHNYYDKIKNLETIYKVKGLLVYSYVSLGKLKKIEFYLYSNIQYNKIKSKCELVLLDNFFEDSPIKNNIFNLCKIHNINDGILFLFDLWHLDYNKEKILDSIYNKTINMDMFNYHFLIGETLNNNYIYSKYLNLNSELYDLFNDNKLCTICNNYDNYEEDLVLYNKILLIKARFVQNRYGIIKNSIYIINDNNEYNNKISLKYLLMNKNIEFISYDNRNLLLNLYLYQIYNNELFKNINNKYFISNFKIISSKKKIGNLKYLIKLNHDCEWLNFFKDNNINIKNDQNLIKIYKKFIKTDDGKIIKDYFINNGIEKILEKMLEFEDVDSIDHIYKNTEFYFDSNNKINIIINNCKNSKLIKYILEFIINIKFL